MPDTAYRGRQLRLRVMIAVPAEPAVPAVPAADVVVKPDTQGASRPK